MPSRSEWKLWRSLQRRKGREASGRFLLEGPRLLAEALPDGPPAPVRLEAVLHTVEAAADPALLPLLDRARTAGVPVHEVQPRQLREVSDAVTPQGVVAVARIPSWEWRDLSGGRILVLDAVQDPGNLGTLARTAEAMALAGLVRLPGTVDPWNPKAVRAAAGSTLRVPMLAMEWPDARARLAEADVPIWAADAAGAPVRRVDAPPPRLALVMGNEAQGVSEGVLRSAERTVSVPMAGRVESLNVAMAGAILMDRLFGDGEASDALTRP